MGTKHLFGRTIDYRFIPLADDEDCGAYQHVSTRVYEDAPSEEQREDHDYARLDAESFTADAWNEVETGEFKITLPAITDPDLGSGEDYRQYHVVTSFKLEAGGATVFVEEAIILWRPDALTSKIRVTPAHIFMRESVIETIQPRANFVDHKIELAIIEIDRVLRARGYSRKRTYDRHKISEAAAHLATALACFDLARDGNDMMEKGRMWREYYKEARDSIPIGYDVTGSDKPAPTEQTFSGAVPLIR